MHISSINLYKIHKTSYNSFKGRQEQTYSLKYPCDEFIKIKKEPPLKRGQVIDDGEIFISNSTDFFRFDINWNKFSEYLKERFKNFNKINIYDYACSDSSEAYSLSMMLQHKFKDGAEKFFPIYAKDIDENLIIKNIKNQKTGAINHRLGIKQIANTLDMEPSEIKENFATTKPHIAAQPEYVSTLKEKITRPVVFEEANILDDIENIDNKNPSLVMCRNMWPYVDFREYPDFANTLYSKLEKGSIVVLGAFDCFFDKILEHNSEKISKALIDAGFTPSDTIINNDGYNLIYEKN